MTILLTVIAVLIVLTLIVFLAPVRITLEVAFGPRPENVEVWFWSWRVYRWRPEAKSAERPDPSKAEPNAKRKARRSSRVSRERIGPIFSLLNGPAGRRLAGRMTRSVSFPEGRLHVVFGLEDPAMTGLIAGPAYAVNASLGAKRVLLEPDFTEEVLSMDGRFALQTSLARLSGPPLRFLFEPGAMRALWILAHGPSLFKSRPQTQTPR